MSDDYASHSKITAHLGTEVDCGHDVRRGLFYAHTRVNTNTAKVLEASAFLYALVEILA